MKKNSFSGHAQLNAEFKKENHPSMAKQYKFRSLVATHLNSLYNTALRMTCNQADAEDLVRDTLNKAFREFNHLQKNTDFKLRTFNILVNEYITTYRKIIHESQNECYDEIEEFYLHKKINEYFNLERITEEDFLEKFHENDIENALENLPYQFRLLVLLCDVEGFSYNEIAAIIDSPLGDIISRLYAGRKLLQRYLWSYANKNDYISNVKE